MATSKKDRDVTPNPNLDKKNLNRKGGKTKKGKLENVKLQRSAAKTVKA